MRILCPLNRFYVRAGLLRGLQQAGCEVLVLDGFPIHYDEMVRALEEFKPDLIFSYAWWDGYLLPEDLAQLIAQYHVPHVYWACDDPTHHHTISLPLARLADLVFTTTEELIPVYRALGKKAAYLQHCCNPELHRKVIPGDMERHDVVLVAANYSRAGSMRQTFRTPSMHLMLEPLIEAGMNLKAFGDGWDDITRPFHLSPRFTGPTIPYEKVAAVYAASKIVLGLQSECHWSTQTSCRPFEVLGCRAFHLAPVSRSMTKLFKPGQHLMVAHTPQETLAMVRYYLTHDEERERIAAAGQKEVYDKHTCLHRAHEFLTAVRELI